MKRLIIFFVCVTFALQAQAEVITFFAAGSVDGRLKTVPGSWVTIDWEDEAPSFFALAKAIGEPDEGWVYFSRSDMMTSATLTTYESIERLTFSNGVYMLTALNLDGAPSIQTVDCRDVGLVSIGIANSANLTNLLCDQNNLTDLDVTNNVNLSTLSCTKNHLTLSVLKQISATMLANGVPLANIRLAEQSLGATFLIINRLFEMPTEETINGKQTYYTVTKEGGATAIPGTDYSITGKQITFHQLGTYKVTMKNEGLVHYDGESENLVFAEYIVHQETPMVDTIPEQVYTGYPIEPPLTVMFDDSLLTPGVDYTVEYNNNTDAGIAKATITGVGQPWQTANMTFIINPITITVEELRVKTKLQDGSDYAEILFDEATFRQKIAPPDDTLIIITTPTSGQFVIITPGVNIPVLTTGKVALTGEKAKNYIVTQQSLTGNILGLDVTVTGDVELSDDGVYVFDCGATSAEVALQTEGPSAKLEYHGHELNSFTVYAFRADTWTDTVTVISDFDKLEIILRFEKRFEVDLTTDQTIVVQKWENTLLVNNNPYINGNYDFISYQWFCGDTAISTRQYYSAGNAASDRLNAADTYYVVMTTAEKQLRTCPFHPAAASATKSVTTYAYPNPVRAGHTVTLYTDEPLQETNMDVYNLQGEHIVSRKANGSAVTFDMPATVGIYLIKWYSENFQQTIKIIVQ